MYFSLFEEHIYCMIGFKKVFSKDFIKIKLKWGIIAKKMLTSSLEGDILFLIIKTTEMKLIAFI